MSIYIGPVFSPCLSVLGLDGSGLEVHLSQCRDSTGQGAVIDHLGDDGDDDGLEVDEISRFTLNQNKNKCFSCPDSNRGLLIQSQQ